MKIQNISSKLYYPKNCQKPKFLNSNNLQNKGGDINFAASILSEHMKAFFQAKKKIEIPAITPFEEFYTKKGKVDFSEYIEIKNSKKIVLSNAWQAWDEYNNKHHMCINPNINAKAAIVLKDLLDKKYNSNYRIISIGTSPATITEAMKSLGCEVVFLPISGMNYYQKGRKDTLATFFKELPNFKKSLDYLKEKGIGKDDKKTNIFLDYTFSGTTLSQVSDFSSEYLKLKKENTKTISLTSLLAEAVDSQSNKDSILSYRDVQYILTDVATQKIGDLCNIPHFNVVEAINLASDKNSISSKNKTEKKLFTEFEEFSRPMGRIFALCSLDEIYNLKQKKSEIIPD